jgi:hypothetical protein
MARRKPTKNKPHDPAVEARIAHGPDPLPNVSPQVEAEVARLSRQVRRYVRRDIEEQRAAVERLMVEGAKCRQITRILRTQWPNITHRTVALRMDQVNKLRAAEAKDDRVQARAFMVERLEALRTRALTGTRPDYKAAIAAEKEISKLLGLYAPTKVDITGDVNHSLAMVSVITNMDPDLASEILQEARTTERLANRARELLPAIDVEVETVSQETVPAASEK